MSRNTLAIFGLTGSTGQALARAALDRGWAVRGLVRPGSASAVASPALHVVRGGFDDAARVLETVTGAHAVCCVIGPRPPHTDAFCAAATAAIVAAMHRAGVRRLVCQTGAMIGPGRRSAPFAWMCARFARRAPEAAADREAQERIVMASGLDWTLLKPPRLTERPPGHTLRVGAELRMGLLSSVGRADLAALTLDAIAQARFVGERVFARM